jgi:hypothetical protein
MDVRSLISLFGQEAGVPLALGESGTVALAFEDGPTVQLEHDPGIDALHCYVVIGHAPSDIARSERFLRQLLQANVFGRETDGATLGLDEATGDIVLSRRLELAHADTAWLRITLESIVAVARLWQIRLADTVTASEVIIGSVPFTMPDPGMRV